MQTASTTVFSTCFVLVLCVVLMARPAHAIDSAEVKALFANPPRDYSTGPLWSWNDDLTDEQIIETLGDLANQKIKQVWVHPRMGLMTPYLSDEWFRLWRLALKEGQRLDMNVWIYDENSYPSGFAGGHVPAAMPESRGQGLRVKPVETPPKWTDDMLAVFGAHDGGYENVTDKVRAGATLPKGRYFVCTVELARDLPWFAGKCCVDLLYPGVTEKFIEVTFEPYRKRFGEQFGKRIPGVFSDEALILPTWHGLPWTKNLPDLFEKRWGYNLIGHLIYLDQPGGDWKKVRHNYYQLLNELFIERWAKPMHDYCENHDLEWTGHYWEHEWPLPIRTPDCMSMYAWHQRPAIDTLFNQYSEEVNAQFGNVRAVKELSSVANQLGRKRTLCEAYGAAGWEFRLEDMKRIGDWLYVLGVNTLNEHLSDITIRGARKRDHPQSFSYHAPWWEAYHIMATYFSRLSVALAQGQQVNRVLIIEPTTSTWLYHTAAFGHPQIPKIANAFQAMVNACEKAQVEYDIGCEDIMARHGAVDGNELIVGKRRYKAVVLTPLTENLNVKTMDLLERFVKNSGTVLCCSATPARVGGCSSKRGPTIAKLAGWKQVEASEVSELLLAATADGFCIERKTKDAGILFHHRRQLDDGQLLFLVNTSIDSSCSGTVESRLASVQKWCPHTGKVDPYHFDRLESGIRTSFQLPPCGSLLLFLSDERREPVPAVAEKSSTIRPEGPPRIQRLDPNVLTLDFVDVTVGDESKKNVYFFDAAKLIFNKHGLDKNPWEEATQFRDELIRKTFPADSGFEATYWFTIGQRVPESLYVVIERSDLYEVTCNGKPVRAPKGAWWLDKTFGKIDIRDMAQVGSNTVSIKASPMTMFHELEPVYVVGDFSLKSTDKGFIIVPETELDMDPWNEQGYPLYGNGFSYVETFDLYKPSGRYRVSLASWYGSVAKVAVNGTHAGYIAYRPWQCDVTDYVVPGKNVVEVIVIGTLKNTLGPHHSKTPLGFVRPTMFQQGPATGLPPGGDYATVGYGLFKPFVLEEVTR